MIYALIISCMIMVLLGVIYFARKLTSFRLTGSPVTGKKLIIFDFDGTLADSFELLVTSYNKIALKYGVNLIDDHDKKAMRDQGPKEVLKKLGVSKIQLPFIVRHLRKEMMEHINDVHPFEGIKEMLFSLGKNYHLGIMTTNSVTNVTHFLAAHELEDTIKFIMSDIGPFGKTKVLKTLISNYKVSPENILYIGDELRDGTAAQQAGVLFGAVTYGFNSEKALRKIEPAFIVHSTKDIVTATENLFNNR